MHAYFQPDATSPCLLAIDFPLLILGKSRANICFQRGFPENPNTVAKTHSTSATVIGPMGDNDSDQADQNPAIGI